MPYKWVPPDVLIRAYDITVYYVYKDNSRMSYWFCLDEAEADSEGEGHFDVRDLPGWKAEAPETEELCNEWLEYTEEDHIRRAILYHLSRGNLDYFIL